MIFSKKTILLLAVLFSFIEFTFAQDSGANVGVDYINPRFDFAPIDSLLPKTITFKNVYTAPLKYCSKDEMEELMNGVTYVYVNHFPGKYAYQNKPAEYIFEYITTGLIKQETIKDRFEEREILEAPLGANPNDKKFKVYMRDFKLYFPCTLRITQFKGGTQRNLRTIVINDGTVPTFYTRSVDGAGKECRSIDALNTISESELNRDMEKTAAAQNAFHIQSILDALYCQVTYKETGQIGYIKKKNRKFDYTDFDKAVEDYKVAIKSRNKGDKVTADSLVAKATQTFESLMESKEPRIDENVKMMLHLNLAWCYFWQGKVEASREHLSTAAKAIGADNTGAVAALSSRLKDVELRNLLKKEKDTNLTTFPIYYRPH